MGHYSPAADAEREIHVLVTGAGPFHSNTTNPAILITRALPPILHGRGSSASTTIHVHALPDPWRVSYSWVRQHVPPLLFPPPSAPPLYPPSTPSVPAPGPTSTHNDGDAETRSELQKERPNYDAVLFIGMAGGRKYYALETQAHRDGYKSPDVDGETMEGDGVWTGLGAPEVLGTGFDTEDLWRRWKEGLMDEDVRPSNDPGRFLCDFIYYTGQLEYWKRNPSADRPVMFLHVPGDHTEEAIEKGVKVAGGLIMALVQSHVDRGKFS